MPHHQTVSTYQGVSAAIFLTLETPPIRRNFQITNQVLIPSCDEVALLITSLKEVLPHLHCRFRISQLSSLPQRFVYSTPQVFFSDATQLVDLQVDLLQFHLEYTA